MARRVFLLQVLSDRCTGHNTDTPEIAGMASKKKLQGAIHLSSRWHMSGQYAMHRTKRQKQPLRGCGTWRDVVEFTPGSYVADKNSDLSMKKFYQLSIFKLYRERLL